jgi:crotonobetainyl-CoA:carnitine CoA-transferase CaiB-like acyl-CoA transferase
VRRRFHADLSEGEMTRNARGPLAGLRILEIYGIGPVPFCGMLLADLGADVVLVDREHAGAEDLDLGKHTIVNRGKRSIALDLKSAAGVATLLGLVENCDALMEGMRPGVMERLGLGPEVCLARNPKLVYGRMTGWGRAGRWRRRQGTTSTISPCRARSGIPDSRASRRCRRRACWAMSAAARCTWRSACSRR